MLPSRPSFKTARCPGWGWNSQRAAPDQNLVQRELCAAVTGGLAPFRYLVLCLTAGCALAVAFELIHDVVSVLAHERVFVVLQCSHRLEPWFGGQLPIRVSSQTSAVSMINVVDTSVYEDKLVQVQEQPAQRWQAMVRTILNHL